jgi:hypothetical protein
MRIRIPSPTDLSTELPLAPLVLLDAAAAITALAIRTRYPAAEGDFFPDETNEITTARVLARECDMLRDTINHYRRRVIDRLARERADWPF